MGLNLFGRFRAPKRIALNDLAKALWQDKPIDKTSNQVFNENTSDPEKTWER